MKKTNGKTSETRPGTSAIELGNNASADGNYAIAIGQNANAPATASIAIASYSAAHNTQSIILCSEGESRDSSSSLTIGTYSAICEESNDGILIGGVDCYKSKNGIAIGFTAVSGENGIAMGIETFSEPTGGISIGNLASTGTFNSTVGAGSVSIGQYATCQHDESVALGAGSASDSSWQVAVGGRRISFLENGGVATDAATYGQVLGTREVLDRTLEIISRLTIQMSEQVHEEDPELSDLHSTILNMSERIKSVLNDDCQGEIQAQPQVKNTQNPLIEFFKNKKAKAEKARKNNDLTTTRGTGVELGPGATTTGDDTVAIGNQANALLSACVAIGNQALSNGSFSIAVGQESQALGYESIAIGYKSTSYTGLALGANAISNGGLTNTSAVAVGRNSSAQGANAFALGISSRAQANYSVAIGDTASATATSSVAIGQNALCGFSNSVALGANSQASSTYQISIGSPSLKRRLSFVSNATNPTDILTVGQLAVVQKYLKDTIHCLGLFSVKMKSLSKNHEDQWTALEVSVNSLARLIQTEFAEPQTEDIQEMRREAMESVEVIPEVTAEIPAARAGTNAVEVGNLASASGNYSVAVGGGAKTYDTGTISIGLNASNTGAYSIGIGNINASSGVGHIVFGYKASATADYSISIKGTVAGANSIAIGSAIVNGERAISIGASSRANLTGCISIGASAYTVVAQGIAVGRSSYCGFANGVALGKESRVTRDNQVAVGIYNATRRISHAANGMEASDAATYRQLRTTQNALAEILDVLDKLAGKAVQITRSTSFEEIRKGVSSLKERVKTKP